MKNKNINFEFDNHIENMDQLINQLNDMRKEALYMMRTGNIDPIFQKDFHALKIVINYLQELKNDREN